MLFQCKLHVQIIIEDFWFKEVFRLQDVLVIEYASKLFSEHIIIISKFLQFWYIGLAMLLKVFLFDVGFIVPLGNASTVNLKTILALVCLLFKVRD